VRRACRQRPGVGVRRGARSPASALRCLRPRTRRSPDRTTDDSCAIPRLSRSAPWHAAAISPTGAVSNARGSTPLGVGTYYATADAARTTLVLHEAADRGDTD
jgi:hypothetical protein